MMWPSFHYSAIFAGSPRRLLCSYCARSAKLQGRCRSRGARPFPFAVACAWIAFIKPTAVDRQKMEKMMNKITIHGNIVRAEIKTSENGTRYFKATVASDRNTKGDGATDFPSSRVRRVDRRLAWHREGRLRLGRRYRSPFELRR